MTKPCPVAGCLMSAMRLYGKKLGKTKYKAKKFYQIGISANTTGISVYVLGLDDKTYLVHTFGEKIGKASVSGYCIKFKTLNDIHLDILKAAILYGIEKTSEN